MSLRPQKFKKVIIDGRVVGETQTGVTRMIRLLAKGLAEQSKLDYDVAFLCRPGYEKAFSGFETVSVRTPHLDPREAITLPALLWREGASLYHSPTHASLLSAPCPWIVTIHDLVALRWGSPLEQIYYQGLLAPFAMRSRRIITPTETLRAEVEKWLGNPLFQKVLNPRQGPAKVEVVPNAIDPAFVRNEWQTDAEISAVLDRYGLTRGRYFLCLTNDHLHKNASLAVRVFQMAKEQLDLLSRREEGEWKLVVTSEKFKAEPGVVAVGNLHDADSLALLRAARALLVPSLAEGFGLSPLEAGVVGISVIASDIPAHREVLNFAGPNEVAFVDPQQPLQWVRPILDSARGTLRPWSVATQQRALHTYSVPTLGQRMDRIYRDVLRPKA